MNQHYGCFHKWASRPWCCLQECILIQSWMLTTSQRLLTCFFFVNKKLYLISCFAVSRNAYLCYFNRYNHPVDTVVMMAKGGKLKFFDMSKLSDIMYYWQLRQAGKCCRFFCLIRSQSLLPFSFTSSPLLPPLPLKDRPPLTLQNGGEEQGASAILCQGLHAAGGAVQKGGDNGIVLHAWERSEVKCQLLWSSWMFVWW